MRSQAKSEKQRRDAFADVPVPAACSATADAWPSWWLWFTGALLFLVLLQMARMTAAFPGCLPIDDAYIIVVYAQNAFHGHFFTYNDGVLSTGLTCPLYALVLAAVHFLFDDWHGTVLATGWMCFLAALALGSRLAWRLGGRWAITAFLVIFGLCGHQGLFATIGMETALVIPLGLAAALAFVARRPFAAGVLAGLATLCRPEALLLVPVFALPDLQHAAVGIWRRERQMRRTAFRNLFVLGVGFGIVLLPWVIYCLQVSHTLLSATVWLKSGPFDPAAAAHFVWQALFLYFPNIWDAQMLARATQTSTLMAVKAVVPMGVLALAALLVLRGDRRRLFVPLLFYPAHVLLAATKHADACEFDRYMPLDYTLVYLYAAVLIGVLLSRTPAAGMGRRMLRLLAAATLVAWGVLLLGDHGYCRRSYAIKAQYFWTLDYSIGAWLHQNTPAGTRVALFQAGGIRFFGERPIIDLAAFTDHTIFEVSERPPRQNQGLAGSRGRLCGILWGRLVRCRRSIVARPGAFHPRSAELPRTFSRQPGCCAGGLGTP